MLETCLQLKPSPRLDSMTGEMRQDSHNGRESCLARAAIGGIQLGWLNDYQGKYLPICSGLGMKKEDKRKEKMKENERRVDET